jgi:type VI protein secretion system component Hcp
MAETVIFLKLAYDGQQVAKGNAEASDFAEQIEIESFSWGVKAVHKNDPDGDTSKAAGLKPTLTPRTVSMTKFYDKSSIKLATGASKRRHVQTATLTFATLVMSDKGQTPQKIMEMEMSDGYIESLSVSASESGKAIAVKEEFTLSFQDCRLSYYSVEGARKTATTFTYVAPPSGPAKKQ